LEENLLEHDNGPFEQGATRLNLGELFWRSLGLLMHIHIKQKARNDNIGSGTISLLLVILERSTADYLPIYGAFHVIQIIFAVSWGMPRCIAVPVTVMLPRMIISGAE
jgi:hypothetical protein